MFVPGNVHQHFDTMLFCEIEEPSGRNVVDPDEIGAGFADMGEIPRDLFR